MELVPHPQRRIKLQYQGSGYRVFSYSSSSSMNFSQIQKILMNKITTSLFLIFTLFTTQQVYAHGQLNATELTKRFTDTTQHCRKEKDQSTCTTYFSADGVIKRRMHADGKLKDGSWMIKDDTNQLCITWTGKTKALCFEAYLNHDGTLDMYKKGRHLSTGITFFEGNVENL